MTSTSAAPAQPHCLQEEEEGKESDSDSEGPIQYRDEEDEDESHQSKTGRGKEKIILQIKLLVALWMETSPSAVKPYGHLMLGTSVPTPCPCRIPCVKRCYEREPSKLNIPGLYLVLI